MGDTVVACGTNRQAARRRSESRSAEGPAIAVYRSVRKLPCGSSPPQAAGSRSVLAPASAGGRWIGCVTPNHGEVGGAAKSLDLERLFAERAGGLDHRLAVEGWQNCSQ
jgi:hypothetical protein